MRAVVFGAASSSEAIYKKIKKEYEIVAYCDNDKTKWGRVIDGVSVLEPALILNLEWDEVIIVSFTALDAIKSQLLDMGISEDRINTKYVSSEMRARKQFVCNFATIIYDKQIEGSCAEAGVFQGEFAKIMNEKFPDRYLYLFDTFTGFDARDIKYEEKNNFSDAEEGYLNLTSEALVLSKMKFPKKCIIKKGYFPESAIGINEKFCMVNLDMDLYKPTLEGLRFFYPLMTHGGIIMIHDYFSEGYEGVNMALKEFLKEINESIVPFPVGDGVSIAIQKR